ncbi:MAG TPA: hypothetical protein DC054_09190 [Blastocatellia bacterium]|nr:hypothetical protein [Blastocatellia bacterium]
MANTPEETLSKLQPFLSHIYPMFEAAVSEATVEEFTSKGYEDIDGCHHSSAIRIRVRRLLDNKPSHLKYDTEPLNNNGLEVWHKGHNIKFFKGVNGRPPAPGKSEKRKAFYQQPLFGDHFRAEKLVGIYNVAGDGTFMGLDLACPKDITSEYGIPELHWSIPVPHPATLQTADAKYQQSPDELTEIRRAEQRDEDDLDISKDGTGTDKK